MIFRHPHEVRVALPLRARWLDQAEVCLVDEGGRLQGMVSAFAGHQRASEPVKLIVDERQQPLCRPGVPSVDLGEQAHGSRGVVGGHGEVREERSE